jgi:hypothetical protein
MDDNIKSAIDSELDRQKASPEERAQLEHSINRAQQSKVFEVGLDTAIESTGLAVENSLRRLRERTAHAKNNPVL